MSDLFIPKSPVNVPIRPIDKGIILNHPSTLLPKGAVLDAKNLWIIDSVLQRRPGLTRYMSTSQMAYAVKGGITLWSIGGLIYNVHWDRKFVYDGATPPYGPRYWLYGVGTVRYTTGKYTLFALTAGSAWNVGTNMIRPGDVISITGIGNYTIDVIQTAQQLKLKTAFGATGGPVGYNLKRTFQNTDSFFIDYCVADNKILFADGGRPIYQYNGSAFSRYVTTPVYDGGWISNWRPRCVAYFMNRVWAANTIETNVHRQRIRWSQVIAHADFRDAGGTDTQWLDLPYSGGQIRKMSPLGNLLMIYLDDCIYSGMPTNIPALPISPQKIETGGVGLVGTKAITSFMGAHYWIGQDDIYALTSKGIERIGTPVVRETIRKCSDLTFCQVCVDPSHDRIMFGFPESAKDMTRIWSFFYKNKAWTYDEVPGSSLDFLGNPTNIAWDNFASYSSDGFWSGIEFSAWDEIMQAGSVEGNVLIGQANGRVFSYSSDGPTDAQNTPSVQIPVRLETGDIDLDQPDDEKCWLRLSIKLRDITTTQINFEVYTNQFRDRATTWKSVGTLKIPANDDEGYVNFRVTSSQIRFKLESSTVVNPYGIQEAVLKVRPAGQETSRVAT